MKTSPKNVLGLASVLALVAGFSSLALAGPGPQYWQQQEKLRAENAAKTPAASPIAKSAVNPAMTCAHCKTSVVQEFSALNVSGKYTPHATTIGFRHECSSCGGAIATSRGTTTNEMKDNCPICAKATPGCCAVNGHVVAAR